ncbi:MAG: hypothetical protein JSS42_12895 [Proteobacteria bacterium]|uniref:hypothetical protein n=1 Tax=Rudaea sp. TaxID=2136325 RepID=UPI0032209DA0|nr:hypothetical protein [Pseudomonadota bacterium]
MDMVPPVVLKHEWSGHDERFLDALRAAREHDFACAVRAHLQEVIRVYDAQKWKTVAAVPEVMECATSGTSAQHICRKCDPAASARWLAIRRASGIGNAG